MLCCGYNSEFIYLPYNWMAAALLCLHHLYWCVICNSDHMTKQTPSNFDGRQPHWAALAYFIAGDCLRVSDANDLPQLSSVKCIKTSTFGWCQPPPPRTHVVREYRDYVGVVQPQALRFLTHRDHRLWKATAASCFLRVTSSTSPSNEQSLRVFHHYSTSGVFLLWCGVPMVVANVDPLPRFNLGSNVASARSIRIIRNSESLTNVSRTINSLSRLIESKARVCACACVRVCVRPCVLYLQYTIIMSLPRLIMIIINIIFLYFIEIEHTDDFLARVPGYVKCSRNIRHE